jgi:hypothetical protein
MVCGAGNHGPVDHFPRTRGGYSTVQTDHGGCKSVDGAGPELDMSDVIHATEMRKPGETSLAWQLKRPQIGLSQASHGHHGWSHGPESTL